MTGKLSRFRHPPKEGDWLVAIYGQLNSTRVRVRLLSSSQQEVKHLNSSQQGAEFKPAGGTQSIAG